MQQSTGRYGFTGEWWQPEVGLLHLRARWLMPGDGVFLSRDPVESEPPYQYVRGNVVNSTDESGKFPQCQELTCPVEQPSHLHEKARISCLDLYMVGGSRPMNRYLEKESISDPAALLARVAMPEHQTNLASRRDVIWIIRYRMQIAHSIGSDSGAEKQRPTDLWTEVSKGGFEGLNLFRNIEAPEEIATNGQEDLRCGGNVNAGFYPCNTSLDDQDTSVTDWIATYHEAQSILAQEFKTGFPEELIVEKGEDPQNDFQYGYDSFWGDGFENHPYAAYPQRGKWIWPEYATVTE